MQQRKLKIYFTSDVHGYFYPTTYGDMTEKNVGLFGCAGNFKKDEDTLIFCRVLPLHITAVRWQTHRK